MRPHAIPQVAPLPRRRLASRQALVALLALVQCAYLAVAVRYLAVHGWPVFGEGKVHPYLGHFAVQVITFPVATLVVPMIWTACVSRGRAASPSPSPLLEVWRNTLVAIPASALGSQAFLEGRIGHVTYRLDQPLWILAGEGVLYLLLADLWFYVSHRALHTRLLYRFHVAHHVQKAPTQALAFFALSPAEAYFSGLLTVFVPLLVIPVHAVVLAAGSTVILACGLYIHESALADSSPRFGLNGPAAHQRHHRRGRRNHNFSLLFTVFDHLLGTWAQGSPAAVRGGDRQR